MPNTGFWLRKREIINIPKKARLIFYLKLAKLTRIKKPWFPKA
jgi:hypothetical protein